MLHNPEDGQKRAEEGPVNAQGKWALVRAEEPKEAVSAGGIIFSLATSAKPVITGTVVSSGIGEYAYSTKDDDGDIVPVFLSTIRDGDRVAFLPDFGHEVELEGVKLWAIQHERIMCKLVKHGDK